MMIGASGRASLAAALLLAGAAWAKTDYGALLTEAKTAADLGDFARASRAFTEVAEGVAKDDPRRWDALVHLGAVRSAMGDGRGSLAAYDRVRAEYASNPQAIRSLALAVSGVVPDGERFDDTWRDIRLAAAGTAGSEPRVAWPRADDVQVPELPGASEKITLSVEEMDLPIFFLQLFGDVLERLNSAEMRGENKKTSEGEEEMRYRRLQPFPDAYRAPEAVERLNLLVHPQVEGRVTVRVTDTPWGTVFAEVLRSHHLRCVTRGSVVWISRQEDPPLPSDMLAARRQSKKDLGGLELRDASLDRFLELVTRMTGLEIDTPPGIQGRITLRLNDLSVEDAFAVVLWANGLTYTRSDDSVRILPLGHRGP